MMQFHLIILVHSKDSQSFSSAKIMLLMTMDHINSFFYHSNLKFAAYRGRAEHVTSLFISLRSQVAMTDLHFKRSSPVSLLEHPFLNFKWGLNCNGSGKSSSESRRFFLNCNWNEWRNDVENFMKNLNWSLTVIRMKCSWVHFLHRL